MRSKGLKTPLTQPKEFRLNTPSSKEPAYIMGGEEEQKLEEMKKSIKEGMSQKRPGTKGFKAALEHATVRLTDPEMVKLLLSQQVKPNPDSLIDLYKVAHIASGLPSKKRWEQNEIIGILGRYLASAKDGAA